MFLGLLWVQTAEQLVSLKEAITLKRIHIDRGSSLSWDAADAKMLTQVVGQFSLKKIIVRILLMFILKGLQFNQLLIYSGMHLEALQHSLVMMHIQVENRN